MADYKALTRAIASWQRCYRITIENPHDSTPSIRFDEEVCTVDDTEVSSRVAGSIVKLYDDGKKSFPLLDPATGKGAGTMTYGEVYAVLWSLYLSLAEERDAQLTVKG